MQDTDKLLTTTKLKMAATLDFSSLQVFQRTVSLIPTTHIWVPKLTRQELKGLAVFAMYKFRCQRETQTKTSERENRNVEVDN